MSQAVAAMLERVTDLVFDGRIGEAASVMDQAIAAAPDRHDLIVQRARIDHLHGDDSTARARLTSRSFSGKDAVEALLLDMEIDVHAGTLTEDKALRAANLVLGIVPWGWSKPHERVLAALRSAHFIDIALNLLSQWLKRQKPCLVSLARAGELLMEKGLTEQAYPLLTNVWEKIDPEGRMLIGPWTGMPEDNPAKDHEVLDEIDRAFDLPETALARQTLAEGPLAADSVTGMFVGGGQSGTGNVVDNDMAAHFITTAENAGAICVPCLDDVLAYPREGHPTDLAMAQAEAAFRDAVAKHRPDFLIVDITQSPQQRGLWPGLVQDLKRRHGFRVAGMVRDALKGAQPTVDLWEPVCDTLIIFDPASYMLTQPHIAPKALIMPVPCLHLPFVPQDGQHDLDLLFVGSTSAMHRMVLLATLAQADVGLEIMIGELRRRLAPDAAAYAGLLARSRAVLNVAGHHPGPHGHLVTGRVFETIACRSLLIEQDYDGSKGFFAPWRHFLPWSEPADLIRRWRVLSRHEDYRSRIAHEAHAWAHRHYSPDIFWRTLVNHVMR